MSMVSVCLWFLIVPAPHTPPVQAHSVELKGVDFLSDAWECDDYSTIDTGSESFLYGLEQAIQGTVHRMNQQSLPLNTV